MIKNIFNRICCLLAYIAPGGYKIRPALHRLRGVAIGKNVWISKFVYIDELHPECIRIGDNCTIGLRTTIYTHLYWGEKRKINHLTVEIGKDTFIGPHSLILPGVKIGEGVVVKGNSVISSNIKSNIIVGLPSIITYGRAEVPLTNEYSYDEFVRGVRPVRKQKGY